MPENTPLSEKQIRRARNVNLEKYLPYKGFTLRRNKGKYEVVERKGVFLWKSFYESKEGIGGNPIDFCINELGMRFNEAVADLNAFEDAVCAKNGW
jgi:hypothetical protein